VSRRDGNEQELGNNSQGDHHESYPDQPARIDDKPASDDRYAKIFPLKRKLGGTSQNQ
jgi:hypothetical protein